MNNIKASKELPRTDDVVIPVKERKTVETLLPDDCRWPIGDPMDQNFHFCGKRRADGDPYCKHHMSQGFQASRRASPPKRLQFD